MEVQGFEVTVVKCTTQAGMNTFMVGPLNPNGLSEVTLESSNEVIIGVARQTEARTGTGDASDSVFALVAWSYVIDSSRVHLFQRCGQKRQL